MRPLHLVLGASLAANLLTAAAYFYTRKQLEDRDLVVPGSVVMQELALTGEQVARLRDTRRTLRAELQPLRAEWQRLFDAAVAKFRAAQPGDTSFEQAFLATGEVRRRQSVAIARALIAFREYLTPAQRETFNRHVGEWPFIEAMVGLDTEPTRNAPLGPFRNTPPAPTKNP